MNTPVNRRPISNFFIKRSLQIRLIQKIVLATIVSTIVSSGSLFLVYFLRYQTVVVYQLDKLNQELSRENILIIILPALLISALVSIIFSVGIGLYASRKYAVPIYKLEQWVSLLMQGKLNALLRFREKDEMKELTDKCNNLGVSFRQTFTEIRRNVELLKQENPKSEHITDLEKILSEMELEAVPIEVNTQYLSVERQNKPATLQE